MSRPATDGSHCPTADKFRVTLVMTSGIIPPPRDFSSEGPNFASRMAGQASPSPEIPSENGARRPLGRRGKPIHRVGLSGATVSRNDLGASENVSQNQGPFSDRREKLGKLVSC